MELVLVDNAYSTSLGLIHKPYAGFNCGEKEMSCLFILLAPQLHYLPKQILDFQVAFYKREHQKIFLGVSKALKMFAEAKFSPFPASKGYGVYPWRRSPLGVTGRTMQK